MSKEIWRDVPGYEGSYQVSNLGRVRSLDRVVRYVDGRTREYPGQLLVPYHNKRGYAGVNLGKGAKHRRLVHRLVAQVFIPNPQAKPEVNHRDGDPSNNRVWNLEWATPGENMGHALRVLQPANWPPFKEKALVAESANEELRFRSTMDAERAGFARQHIRNAVVNGRAYRGYRWSFAA